ncbi:DnaJ-domain-containing protein [Amniculicola lignicola CBS 123094]|uniref:DnaJ-domain-containing protein n=1 Tax=Amniculicola lignicola CBS 123094 TaxID=1392246 RepID=A0A6A5WIN5_9PLEO|nr:DnaJ-domain-containing protein [Amniculicola lignicola CBS 123094]
MDPLPPDPYAALGVSKSADAATIKSTYRKLALKCHPDKVTDPSLKKQKEEEFHRIQQAYEILGDDDKRKSYEAELRLDTLRKEKLARGGNSNPDIRTTHYEVRTAAPAGATFGARGSTRYEERRPTATTTRGYDEERYYDERSSSRKYPTYEAQPKHTSSTARSSRPRDETPIKVTRVSSDRTRSDTKKARDREVRNERSSSGKFPHPSDESSSDEKAREKARWEADYKRRDENVRAESRRQAEIEEVRRAAAELRKKTEGDRRSYEEVRHRRSDDRELYDRQRKLSEQELEAKNYIGRAREAETRPSPIRQGSSSRDVRAETSYFDSRSSRRDRERDIRVTPVDPRRSSAPRKERPSSSGRDRDRKGVPEIVEWESEIRSPPSFKHSSSSPADLHIPRATPQRAQTESSRDHRRSDPSPTPAFRRAETMPSPTEPRRKETIYPRSSGLRRSETAKHEPIVEPVYAPLPVPGSSSTKKYYYPTPAGGVSLHPDDVGVANGHRTILREPDRHRTRSPSPLSKPPIGPHRPVEAYAQVPLAAPRPPTLGRSATMNVSTEAERGRSRPLYGEVGADRRENVRGRQASFSPEKVAYAPKIGPDDIRWSGRRDSGREYPKPPTLGRTATYVY